MDLSSDQQISLDNHIGLGAGGKVASSSQSSFGTLSRTSSVGSCMSSPPSEDDEDSDISSNSNYKNRRREAHTLSEQKRRDAIKKGYDDLQDINPMCSASSDGQKPSKALVLQKSIDYINWMNDKKQESLDEVGKLKSQLVGLQIMKANLEQFVTEYASAPHQEQNVVPDNVKFQVFEKMMDRQFETFDQTVSLENFAEMSGCVFSWLETYCTPTALKDVAGSVLSQVKVVEQPPSQH